VDGDISCALPARGPRPHLCCHGGQPLAPNSFLPAQDIQPEEGFLPLSLAFYHIISQYLPVEVALESMDPGFAALQEPPSGDIHFKFNLKFLSLSPSSRVPHPIAGMFYIPLALQSLHEKPALACMGYKWLWVKYSCFTELS